MTALTSHILANPGDGGGKPLVEGILAQASARPTAPALIWRDRVTTHGGLVAMARAAAARMDALGLDGDTPVGLVVHKTPKAVAAILACLMTGRRFVLPSARLAPASLTALLDGAGCQRVLVPEAATADSLPLLEATVLFDGGMAEGMEGAWFPEPAAPPRVAEADTFMLTTSGSTGLPKVVPLPAAAVDAFTDWGIAHFDLGPGKLALNHAPLNFDLCLLDVWAVLKAGGGVVLVEEDLATNTDHLFSLLDARPIHLVQAVPMVHRLLTEAKDGKRAYPDTAHVIFTGDVMPRSTLAALPGLFPGARLHNVYGCTETNDSFIHEVGIDPDGQVEAGDGPVPIGQPLPGVHALLLDEEGRAIDGEGVGELLVSTPFQTRGYQDASRNDGKFSTHRVGGADRLFFHAGDMVRRHADGGLTLEGRKDFRVKVRGVLVNPQEVERVLLGHEAIREVAVLAPEDPVAGHLLHAVIQRVEGGALNSMSLRQYCAAHLPRAAIPSRVDFVEAALPKTSTGKLDRRRLSQAYDNRSKS